MSAARQLLQRALRHLDCNAGSLMLADEIRAYLAQAPESTPAARPESFEELTRVMRQASRGLSHIAMEISDRDINGLKDWRDLAIRARQALDAALVAVEGERAPESSAKHQALDTANWPEAEKAELRRVLAITCPCSCHEESNVGTCEDCDERHSAGPDTPGKGSR